MADKKISQLSDAAALTGGELVELVQGGVNLKTTTQQIADLGGAGSGTVESVTGDGVDNTDPDNPVMDLSAYALLDSPAFINTPTAPTAADATDTDQIATCAFVQNNALGLNTSSVYPDGFSHQVHQQLIGPGANDRPLEVLNIGYTGHGPTDDIHLAPTALVRINGRLQLSRNVEWDSLNSKWLTPFQTASAFGSTMLEIGGESVILHATPAGVNFSDVPHEILMASANGADGVAGITTGYLTQSKAPFFAWYNDDPYDPEATNNSWNPSTSTDPMVWLGSNEIKGTAGTHGFNEFMRIESYGATPSDFAFGAINFQAGNGSYASKTAISTGKTVGSIGSKAYDGVNPQKTAEIQFIARGTISSGNAGQSIKFLTGATNTASLLTRMDISHDGAIKTYVPSRFDIPAITTIPDYTGNGYTPALSNGTVAQVQPASTTNGGMIFQGFTVSGNAAATALIFRGIQGHVAPTGANTQFVAMKHNGTTNFTAIANTEIGFHFKNNTTVLVEMLGNGNTGFGVTTPTAKVQVRGNDNTVALLVEDDAGNDILSVGESGGARVVGFFGVTPVARPVVPTGSSTDTLITALQNLGLISQS